METFLSSSYSSLGDALLPSWVELYCLICFFFGSWYLMRRLPFGGAAKPVAKAPRRTRVELKAEQVHSRIQEHIASGNLEEAVSLWREVQAKVPTAAATLRLVVRALLVTEPKTMAQEIIRHLKRHSCICDTRSAFAILDVLSYCQNPALLAKMHHELHGQLQIQPTFQVYEALLGGYAAAGDEHRVKELITEVYSGKHRLTVQARVRIVKGFLQQGLLDAGMVHVRAMLKDGFYVPSVVVSKLLKVAGQADRIEEVFSAVVGRLDIPADAIALIFEDSQRRRDSELARRIESLTRSTTHGGRLPMAMYCALIKVSALTADPHAQELFEEMQRSNVNICDNLCASLLVCCAESKFLSFAQEVVSFLRAGDGMTLTAYAGLVKVYSCCGLHDLACDLYAEIRGRGLQPDSAMYSELMKCAVKVGRSEFAQELFDAAPQVNTQIYMLLIQSAGRDKDVDRAFQVLARLKSSGLVVDQAVYNCVLDACVCAGDMRRARNLMREMRDSKLLDIIGCNTLLKGYVALGDANACRHSFGDIIAHGLRPNQISYNCLIHAAATAGDLELAWETVYNMEAAGFKVDRYTTSIMLHALKSKQSTSSDAHRTLSLLDRMDCILGSDGVLLHSAIDTCIRFRIWPRLHSLLEMWEQSSMRPCIRTYAMLVKAYGALENVDRCRELWRQVVRERGIEAHNIVLGCFLTALVSNGAVTEAVSAFREAMEDNASPNIAYYGTLIKGLNAEGRVEQAVEMWHEAKMAGVQPNTSVYNVLIDMQARKGSMDEVHKLLEGMEEDGVPRDSVTFCTVVKGYCRSGSLDKAINILRAMQAEGLVRDCVVYNTILAGCIQQDRMDLAELIARDLKEFNIVPSHFTFGILVKMYGRRCEIAKAFALVEEMRVKHGLLPNLQISTCLMSACIYINDIDRGLVVFEELKQTGVDTRAIEVMILGLVRVGRVAEAVGIVEEAYGLRHGRRLLPSRQHLSAYCFERLVRAIGQQGSQQHLGVPLLERLRAAGVTLNIGALNTLLEHEG